MSDVDRHRLIEEREKKLELMESDLKRRCDELDSRLASLKKENQELEKREKDLEQDQEKLKEAMGNLDASQRFQKIQMLLDEVYTLYVSAGGMPDDLHESIKLSLQARAKFP